MRYGDSSNRGKGPRILVDMRSSRNYLKTGALRRGKALGLGLLAYSPDPLMRFGFECIVDDPVGLALRRDRRIWRIL